jgi:hypothetical protein
MIPLTVTYALTGSSHNSRDGGQTTLASGHQARRDRRQLTERRALTAAKRPMLVPRIAAQILAGGLTTGST